jgi:hypothetical protein
MLSPRARLPRLRLQFQFGLHRSLWTTPQLDLSRSRSSTLPPAPSSVSVDTLSCSSSPAPRAPRSRPRCRPVPRREPRRSRAGGDSFHPSPCRPTGPRGRRPPFAGNRTGAAATAPPHEAPPHRESHPGAAAPSRSGRYATVPSRRAGAYRSKSRTSAVRRHYAQPIDCLRNGCVAVGVEVVAVEAHQCDRFRRVTPTR